MTQHDWIRNSLFPNNVNVTQLFYLVQTLTYQMNHISGVLVLETSQFRRKFVVCS